MKKIFNLILVSLLVNTINAQFISTTVGGKITVTNPLDISIAGGTVNVPADGSYNIGTKAILSTKGAQNLLIGENAGILNTGNHNVFIGAAAGQSNTSGIYNLFLGGSAGAGNTTGTQNIFMGGQAGFNNTIGYDNVFIGLNAGLSNSIGHHNLFMGTGSGGSNTSGIYNTFIGSAAGGANTTGTQNTFIGGQAGYNNTIGYDNFFIGLNAGFSNVGGHHNLFIGNSAGGSNSSGIYNTFIGPAAGGANTTGTQNTFIGGQAGNSNTTGGNNLFMGLNSGFNNLTGTDNVFLGNSSGGNNTSGSNNVFIGSGAQGTSALTNAGAIGANATVSASNSLVLGNGANIGIGVSAPTDKLHVVGGVRFQGLPTDAPGGTAVQYLVADATGKVYVYTGAAPARIGAPEGAVSAVPNSFTENWTLKNDFLYNKNKKGIIIGEGITSLPKGYGMYVTDGILTEKVKVAIKNSSDWADYVFNKDYKKMTLTEVEKFISVNKHLPNIPSAAEMVLEGNDLAKTDAKLLAKIEELTLYMIEMKKENVQMKRQISYLKRKMNK